MATKILLQTTIPYVEDDWHVGRFSLLRKELETAAKAGRSNGSVVARNRETGGAGDDPVLSQLAESDFDQLWLMAVDTGDGLSPNDIEGILRFRQRGGGVVTARDHQDLGACLCDLGSIGIVNYFHERNPEPDPSRWINDDPDNPNISYPNYHSGANGDYQRIAAPEPVHELLRSERSSTGTIAFFPAHPHEGAVGPRPDAPLGRVIATGTSMVTGRPFNLAVALEREPGTNGESAGRALAVSSFHHFVDLNWDVDLGCPSFVTDKPGYEIKTGPSRLEIFKDYVHNIVRWLGE
ncbi:MAG: hypothetical protein ACXWNZ_12825 [Vulcanimicrobiaceae bacterium]